MKFGTSGIAAFWAFALSAASAASSEPGLRSGIYDVNVETVMPHLEENLRYANTRERYCVLHGDASSLFPILKHKSMVGCRLGGASRRSDATVFQLICENPTVATGAARLKTSAGAVVGELNVKMGGKNMTFSQRIAATRRGECGTQNR